MFEPILLTAILLYQPMQPEAAGIRMVPPGLAMLTSHIRKRRGQRWWLAPPPPAPLTPVKLYFIGCRISAIRVAPLRVILVSYRH
jgi:hypothetical protein